MALAPVLCPSVIVIDLGLPTTDGIALVETLRSMPELSCQFIAVTAYWGARLPALCQAAGFGAFLEKPVMRAELVECVSSTARREERARYH